MEAKYYVVIALMLALIAVKLFAGGKPFDRPVRRARRFGHRGALSPLNGPQPPAGPPPDPEKEFFDGG